MHRNNDSDDDHIEDTTTHDDGVSLDKDQADEQSLSTMAASAIDRQENGSGSSFQPNEYDGMIESPHRPWQSDVPPINSETKRSLTLMQRIGNIKKRLSQSSLSHHQHFRDFDECDDDGHDLRSKSMPMISQLREEILLDDPSLASTTGTCFHDTPLKTSRISYKDDASPAMTTPKNESTVSTTPIGGASRSFQSFSTMDSDVDVEQILSNKNQRMDDAETVNVSRTSQRSSKTPVPEHRVCRTPSTPQGPTAADTEQSDYVVDEQRANVVEKLRGAAFKRRMDVSRSRDSLIAKEQLHREQNLVLKIASPAGSHKDDPDGREQDETKNKRDITSSNEIPINQFRALPLPKTTGLFEGSYGLAGVPNIRKKEPTKANSPCLGRRRQQRTLAYQETEIKPRLLPPTYKEGGSIGIPRIAKKPATVASSPMLGLRRAQSAKPASSRRSSVPHFRRKSLESNSSGSSGSLLGLALYNKENPTPPLVQTPINKKKIIQPFVPHSTKRAAQRSAYDARMVEYEHKLREQQQRDRKMLIKTIERDIEKIRKKL
jgi:hypothetical protein